MNWRSWNQYLFPQEEKQDPAFRDELSRLSVIGLRAIAAVSVGASLVVRMEGSVWVPELTASSPLWVTASIVFIGVTVGTLSFFSWVKPGARFVGILAGYLIAATLILGILGQSALDTVAEHHIPGDITLVMLVGLGSLPMKPLHTLLLGFSMIATYLIVFLVFGSSDLVAMHVLIVSVVVLICAGLTAMIYHQRVSAYRARRQAVQTFEDLRRAQARLLVSENSASQSRFAAALSHELNSPIGALSTALETLMAVFDKERRAPQEQLQQVVASAAQAARSSCERLKETVERMKHLTNLDRAEMQVVDLNELWTNTVSLLSSELEDNVEVKLELRPLPPIRCRPQHVSAVFSNLLRNAVAAIKDQGTIRVISDTNNGEVVLEVRDSGIGISPDRLAHLFDPVFRVRGSRVSTTNWGLFVSRSIIAEHGGQIEIDSVEGKGTTARILIPIRSSLAGWEG